MVHMGLVWRALPSGVTAPRDLRPLIRFAANFFSVIFRFGVSDT